MSQRRYFYLLLLIIGLGFALRVYQLDARPFWFDEGLTVDLAIAPPSYVLDTIDRPPVYYLILHEWVNLAGVSPFALRFFSAWWGTLALVFFYCLARQLVDRRLSLWALLLATFSPFYIYYAQEARTYSLTLTLALMSSWALLVWLKQRRLRFLILNAAATLACLYTHYSLLLLPLAQGIFVLVVTWHDFQPPGRYRPISSTLGAYFLPLPFQRPRHFTQLKRSMQWIGAHVIVGLLFLPWLVYAQRGLPELIAPHVGPSLLAGWQHGALFVWTTLLQFSAGGPVAWPMGEIIALAFVFLIGLGLLSPDLPRPSRLFLSILLLIPPPIMLLLPRTSVYYEPKYLILITPAFYLLAVVGAAWLRHIIPHVFDRRLAVTLSVTLAVGMVLIAGRAATLTVPERPTPDSLIAEVTPTTVKATPFRPAPYPTAVPFFNTTPEPTGRIIQSFWADDATDYRKLGPLSGVAASDEGSMLSYIHPVSNWPSGEQIAISPDNHIYFWGYRFEVYDPIHDVVEGIPLPYPESWIYSLAIAPDERVYGVATYGGYKDRHDQLFVYDPATHAISDLRVVSPTQYLVAGSNGLLYGFLGNVSLGQRSFRPPYVYDVVSDETGTLSVTIQPGAKLTNVHPILGEDGLIYGTAYSSTGSSPPPSFVFALNVTSGTIITDRVPAKTWVSSIASRPGGGVYLGTDRGLWTFDPVRRQMAAIPLSPNYDSLVVAGLSIRRNGQLYGIGAQPERGTYLFSFNPSARQIERLESFGMYPGSTSQLSSSPDDRAYAMAFDSKVYYYEPGQHVSTGTLLSQPIAPIAVVMTRTYISQQNASVEDLTCGADSKVYGVKTTPAKEDWLFWYDPSHPGQINQAAPEVAREDQQPFTGGTTIVALPDGRLVGGTRNGHLFVVLLRLVGEMSKFD